MNAENESSRMGLLTRLLGDNTSASGLPLPKELLELVKAHHWPTRENYWVQESSHSPFSPERVKRFAENESRICLSPLPLTTAAILRKRHEKSFWDHPMAAASEIDLEKSVVIGDFGLGSDAPIILDYRRDMAQPAVLYLQLYGVRDETKEDSVHWDSHWVMGAASFAAFVEFLDLWNVRFGGLGTSYVTDGERRFPLSHCAMMRWSSSNPSYRGTKTLQIYLTATDSSHFEESVRDSEPKPARLALPRPGRSINVPTDLDLVYHLTFFTNNALSKETKYRIGRISKIRNQDGELTLTCQAEEWKH